MADERPESKSERQTLQVLIRELSERGNQPAIVALQEKSIERWSYRKLAVHVSKLARGLIEAGLEGGQHVAMFAENSPEWIVACLAAIEAGGVVVPIDLQLDEETLGHVLTDSEARFVFTTSRACKRLRSVKLDGKLRCILLDADEADKQSWRRLISEKTDKFPTADPNDEAVLFYTSGTTGKPKGVPLSHANLVHQINALIEAKLITENDRALLPLPLHHVYPFAIGMLNSLALGLPIVLPYSLTGPQIVRAIKEGEVTLILGVPRLYRALYSGIESRAKSKGRIAAALFEASLDCCLWLRQRLGLRVGKVLLHPLHQHIGPKIRVMASGGAALDPDLAWKLEALGWRVAIGYGLTETAPLLTLKPPGEGSPDHVGRAISGVELRIDPAAKPGEGERKPSADATREEGEVLARGPNVFRGYRNLPDKTKEAFTGGWFRTGDLGYLDEHEQLHITGRASTMIVTESGKHIQPDDLEKAYLEHPAISEIGVLKQENKLVALIVPKMAKAEDQGGKAAQAVREAMKQTSGKLASYQRISEYAITSDPLPRTRLGKIQRHLLAERYERAK